MKKNTFTLDRTYLLAAILIQKIILLPILLVLKPDVLAYGDMWYYLQSDNFSVQPYQYWQRLLGFTDQLDNMAIFSAFLLSLGTIVVYILYVVQGKISQSVLLIAFLLLFINPYYNLYFFKNTADMLVMNAILLFCIFLHKNNLYAALAAALVIVLTKPFLLFIVIWFLMNKFHFSLNIVISIVILSFIIISATVIYDYNNMLPKLAIGINKATETPIDFIRDYLTRILSFFTQRERARFATWDDLKSILSIFEVLRILFLVFVGLCFLSIIKSYKYSLFLVTLVTILIICLNAGHLRYAFLIYLFPFHIVMSKLR
ncbi:hypothetical protein N9D73_00785 [Planktomarina temperata]|nr:hypothetical protein [Planktomarina temperata]